MLVEPDRMKRNGLFEYVAKPLEAFVAPGHLLRQIDQHIDFRKLAEPLHEAYVPDQGRPAIPPETLVRALVLGYLYRIPSFRKLCTAIQENLAFRWFLYLGLEDEVFDPSFSSPFRPAEGSTPRARPPWDSVEGGDRLQRYPHYVSEGDGPRQCGEGRVPCSDSTTRGGCDMQIRGASGRETRRCPR